MTLFAVGAFAHVQVDMILVKAIVLGPDHRVESRASGLVDGPQEGLGVLAAVPTVLDGDGAPVRQREGGDIDGVGARVLRRRCGGLPARAVTGVGTETADPHDIAAQALSGRGEHVLVHPLVE